jgi:hypothetical protein
MYSCIGPVVLPCYLCWYYSCITLLPVLVLVVLPCYLYWYYSCITLLPVLVLQLYYPATCIGITCINSCIA